MAMDLMEDDDENMEQRHAAEDNAAPKEEPDQDQQNSEAHNAPQAHPGAMPRPAPEMSEQPPNNIARKLKAAGTY